MQEQENGQTTARSEKSGNARDGLLAAKARFVIATEAFEPMGIVKRNPLKSAGLAFLAGFLLTGSKGKSVALTLLPSLVQAGSLLARYGIARLK